LSYNIRMKFFHQIASIFLALLVFVASSGFTVHKHYCGTNLASVSLYHDAGCACGDMDKEKEDECCRTETKYIVADINPDLPVVSTEVSPKLDFTLLAFFVPSFLYLPQRIQTPDYLNYKPPLLDIDIPILVQAFRI